jgi:hypothetical protein
VTAAPHRKTDRERGNQIDPFHKTSDRTYFKIQSRSEAFALCAGYSLRMRRWRRPEEVPLPVVPVELVSLMVDPLIDVSLVEPVPVLLVVPPLIIDPVEPDEVFRLFRRDRRVPFVWADDVVPLVVPELLYGFVLFVLLE